MIYVNTRAIIERNSEENTEIVIQTRNKPKDSGKLELPGGQVNEFESLIEAVKREVLEETGLEVVFVEGESGMVNTSKKSGGFSMECIRPFAVYQTIAGPVDSMGVYFKCKAKGVLKDVGDCSLNAKWININELHSLVKNSPHLFSDIDLAGILFYLKEKITIQS